MPYETISNTEHSDSNIAIDNHLIDLAAYYNG